VPEKRVPVMIVEFQAQATPQSKTVDWRPPLLVVEQAARATLRLPGLPPLVPLAKAA
jgi:hypothetical protein